VRNLRTRPEVRLIFDIGAERAPFARQAPT